MLENINSTYGVIYSGRVLNFLIENSNNSREDIYDYIQKLSFKAMESKTNLKDLILNDKYIMSLIQKEEIEALFNYDYVFKNIEKIYKKAGI